jgi:hypothetical protein
MKHRDVQPIGARRVDTAEDFVKVLLDKRGPWVANRETWKPDTPWIDLCRGSLMNASLRDSDGRCASKLAEYRRWLWAQIKARNLFVLAELREVSENHTIVCCCSPEPCSAEVVVQAWRWMREGGKL